jgi:hypothetical protein
MCRVLCDTIIARLARFPIELRHYPTTSTHPNCDKKRFVRKSCQAPQTTLFPLSP